MATLGFSYHNQKLSILQECNYLNRFFHEKYEVIIARNHPNIYKTGVPFGTGLGMKFWTNSGCGTDNFTVNDNLTKMTKNSWWWVFKHYLHTQQAILILLFWNDKVYAFIAYRPHFLGSLKRPPYGHIRSPKQLRWSCHFRLIGLTPLSLM